MTSTLPELKLDELIKERRETLLTDALARRVSSTARAHCAVDDIRVRVGKLHDDPTDAANAEADVMEAIADRLEDNSESVVREAALQQQSNAEQVRELESRNSELEDELNDLRSGQDDLERSAQRASDLQIKLDEAEREIRRLEGEKRDLLSRNTELETQINQPNPLKAGNDSLNADKRRLEGENRQLKTDKEAAEARATEAERKLAAVRPTPEPAPEPEDPSDEGAREGVGGLRFHLPQRRSRRGQASN